VSHFGDYIKERLGKEIIEIAEGFATYYFFENDMCCYLEDIYIEPASRRKGVATILAKLVEEKAREKGAIVLFGSVLPAAGGSTASLKALLAYGFELHGIEGDLIMFKKPL
jgi:GNAT superfamily N-acetyltransferase